MAPAAVRQSWQVPLEVEQAYYDLVLGGLCLPASEQAKTAGSSLIARLATRRSVKPKNAHTEIVLGQDGMPALAASRLLVNHNPRTSSRRQFNRSTLVGADYRIPLASAGAQAEWEAWVGRLSSADQRTLVRANLIEDTRYAQASLTSWVSVTPAAAAALGPRRVEAPAPSSSLPQRAPSQASAAPVIGATLSRTPQPSPGPRPAQEERNTLSAASSASQRVSEGSESSSHGRASLARSASIRKSLAEDTSSSSEDGDDDGDEEEYQDEVAGWAQRRQLGAGSEDDHPILPSAKAIGKRPIPLIKRSESAEEEARASMPPPIIPPSSSALLNNTPAAPVYDRRATSSTLSSLLATGSRSASVASVVTEARPSQKRRASTELDSHRRRDTSAPEPLTHAEIKQERALRRSSSAQSPRSQQKEEQEDHEAQQEERTCAYLHRRITVKSWVVDLIIDEGYYSRDALRNIKHNPARKQLLADFFANSTGAEGQRLTGFVRNEITQALTDVGDRLECDW